MEKIKSRNIKIGEVGISVLSIVAVAGAVSVAVVLPGAAVMLAPFFKKKKYSKKQVIERNIDSLVKRGLLKKSVRKNGTISLELTKLGKWEAGIRGIDKDSDRQKKWDKLWRIVIFDVAEHQSKMRQELRRALTLYGFRQLQKSVWVYPHSCEDFVQLIKGHLNISVDVLYMTANYIENDKELKREFRL